MSKQCFLELFAFGCWPGNSRSYIHRLFKCRLHFLKILLFHRILVLCILFFAWTGGLSWIIMVCNPTLLKLNREIFICRSKFQPVLVYGQSIWRGWLLYMGISRDPFSYLRNKKLHQHLTHHSSNSVSFFLIFWHLIWTSWSMSSYQ